MLIQRMKVFIAKQILMDLSFCNIASAYNP